MPVLGKLIRDKRASATILACTSFRIENLNEDYFKMQVDVALLFMPRSNEIVVAPRETP